MTNSVHPRSRFPQLFWALLLCAGWTLSAGAQDFKAIEINDLRDYPHKFWAMGVTFEDELVDHPAGNMIRVDDGSYESFTLRKLGTVTATPEAAADIRKLKLDKAYLFSGTVKQRKNRFYVVVQSLVVPMATHEDLLADAAELEEVLTANASDVPSALAPLAIMLQRIEQALHVYASDNGITIEELFDPAGEHATAPAMISQRTIRRLEQKDGTTVQELLASYLTGIIRKRYRPDLEDGDVRVAGTPIGPVTDEATEEPETPDNPLSSEWSALFDAGATPIGSEEPPAEDEMVPTPDVSEEPEPARIVMEDERTREDDVEVMLAEMADAPTAVEPEPEVDDLTPERAASESDLAEFPGLEEEIRPGTGRTITNEDLAELDRVEPAPGIRLPQDEPEGVEADNAGVAGFVPGLTATLTPDEELGDQDILNLIDELAADEVRTGDDTSASQPRPRLRLGPFRLSLYL